MITQISVFDLKGWRKIGIKSEFVINRVSVGYKSGFQKVLNWTSKGRLYEAQRACIGFEVCENSLQNGANEGRFSRF